MSEQGKGAIFQQAVEFSKGLRKSGVHQAGDPLQPTSTATTVRMKNGKTVTTDGLFAETKEQLGDYHVVGGQGPRRGALDRRPPPVVAGGPLDRGAAD